jgi:hypothetical protein
LLTVWLKVKTSVGAGTGRYSIWLVRTGGPGLISATGPQIRFFKLELEPILEPKPECKLVLGSQFHLCSGPEPKVLKYFWNLFILFEG